jgi:hypothetical protein
VLDNVEQAKNLKEDYKRFLKMKQQHYVKEFIREKYKGANVNLSGVLNYINYKIYFTKTLEDVERIVENIKATFLNC